jgi:hypothetical protein
MHSLFDGRCLESTYAWEPNSSAPLLSISVRTRTAHSRGRGLFDHAVVLDPGLAGRTAAQIGVGHDGGGELKITNGSII